MFRRNLNTEKSMVTIISPRKAIRPETIVMVPDQKSPINDIELKALENANIKIPPFDLS